MSFDMFVQAFRDGNAEPMPAAAFLEVFGPHVETTEPDKRYWQIHAPDGGRADIYASIIEQGIDSVLLNHFSSGDVLDLVVEFARKAGAVIMPVGCPILLVDGSQGRHLPEHLQDAVHLVATGDDVLVSFNA
ncbi:hypothetical protein [Nocardia sp. NPDC051832]|uniref:hypothetical protein n=1 Tax=Nocardia sp. NPDC051832 TaxID=3155673 RepID=UPI0034288CE3